MKHIDPDDPMEPMAEAIVGDPEIMLACLVEEYAGLGHNEAEILAMFSDPFFQASGVFRHAFGPDGLAERVRRVLGRCGVLRVQTRVSVEAPEELQEGQTATPAAPDRRDGKVCV